MDNEELLEINIKLKEDIKVLENMYASLMKEFQSLISIPDSVYGTLRIAELMCTEQVKSQRNEKSSQVKFDSVEKFAEYLGMMISLQTTYLKEKYNLTS